MKNFFRPPKGSSSAHLHLNPSDELNYLPKTRSPMRGPFCEPYSIADCQRDPSICTTVKTWPPRRIQLIEKGDLGKKIQSRLFCTLALFPPWRIREKLSRACQQSFRLPAPIKNPEDWLNFPPIRAKVRGERLG